MKGEKIEIIAISLMALIMVIPSVMAAPLGSTESIVSPPVGIEILPGGDDRATDIKTSLIFSKIIPFLISYAIGLAIGLAVLALIFAGYQFMTSYGNTEQNEKARKTATYAVIGLILSLTAYGIVKIVTNIQLS